MAIVRTIRAVRSWLTGSAATREYETLLDRGDRQVPASVILPRGARRNLPGWIVLHGITRPGRFHPNLLRFVRAMASSGLAVVVPQVPEWKNLRLAPEVALPTMRGALEVLRRLDVTNDGPYGVIGFSFGAPHVMIAASHADVGEQLGGVVGFGGYCDMERMVHFQMTGEHEWAGVTHRTRPDPYGRWIIGGNHLTSIPEYADAEDVAQALWRLAVEAGERRILAWDPSYDALKGELRRQVAPKHARLFDLFAPSSDQDPDLSGAEDIAIQLATAVRGSSPLMDPIPYMPALRTPVHLIHGEDDQLIPYTETLRMRSQFTSEQQVDTTITALFSHSDQGGRLSSIGHELREGLKLARTLKRVLSIA